MAIRVCGTSFAACKPEVSRSLCTMRSATVLMPEWHCGAGTEEEESLFSPRPSSRSSTIAGRPLSGRLMSSGRNVMTSHSRGSLHSVNYSDTMSDANFGY